MEPDVRTDEIFHEVQYFVAAHQFVPDHPAVFVNVVDFADRESLGVERIRFALEVAVLMALCPTLQSVHAGTQGGDVVVAKKVRQGEVSVAPECDDLRWRQACERLGSHDYSPLSRRRLMGRPTIRSLRLD